MPGPAFTFRRSLGSLVAAGLVLGMVPAPAAAQVDARIERIEAQMRALQRAVFPGGDERYFEPEIPNQPAQQQRSVTTPSSSALTDVLSRLEAIETQLARLVAATEVNENALAQVDRRLLSLEEARNLAAAQPAPAQQRPVQPSGVIPVPTGNAELPPAQRAPTPAPAASGPSDARLAAVQEIAKPATGDAGDDEYVYGFRLWEAKLYPEAQQQLALFVERYPNHRRTTYGRNLLGRAYLDTGDARRAATYFFENYQADKQADRAPDSLLYLAESMISLGDTNRACIALAEFGDTYPALAAGRLKSQYEANRARVDCN